MRPGLVAQLGLAAIAAVAVALPAPGAFAAFPGGDGKIVYGYGGDQTSLYTTNPDGTGRRLIYRARCLHCAQHLGGDPEPAVSPDGRKVVFRHNDRLFVIGIGGGRARRITPGLPAEIALDPTWSPDGRSVAYIHARPNKEQQLWAVRADGSHRHVLLRRPYLLPPVRWSSTDRDSILVQSFDGFELFSVHSQRLRLLGSREWSVFHADFAPDGRRVVYDCMCSVNGFTDEQLVYVPVSGSDPPSLAFQSDSGNELDPVWSPSGTQFLVRADSSDQNVRIIGLDGNVRTVLPITDKAEYDWQAVP